MPVLVLHVSEYTQTTRAYLQAPFLLGCTSVCDQIMRMKFKIRSTVVSPVVLYECETWCHTLWEEGELSGVLRGQFGPNVGQVTGDGRELHNEELHDKFSSPNRGGSDGQGMWYLWGENFVEGRPRCGYESIIKMDVKEVEWEGVEWFDGRDEFRAVVNVAVNRGVT